MAEAQAPAGPDLAQGVASDFSGETLLGHVDPTLGYKLSVGANQLKTLPWMNLNTVSIQFNEGVTIGQNDLMVVGSSNGPAVPAISGFSWNNSTFVATWTFVSLEPIEGGG